MQRPRRSYDGDKATIYDHSQAMSSLQAHTTQPASPVAVRYNKRKTQTWAVVGTWALIGCEVVVVVMVMVMMVVVPP
jgi:hypothetical protein